MRLKISDSFKRLVFDIEDQIFEWRYGLDLGGVVTNKDLVATNKSSTVHATAYQAVWCRNLRELLAEAFEAQSSFDNFIDIGSGKGKACFYSATKYSFGNILGIEFSAPLIEIANRNKEIFGATNITFVCSDATEFTLPDKNNLVFLFNPFDGVVLEKFLANNIAHFQKKMSFIAYANDTQRMSLTRFGFETLFRNQTRKISLFHYPKS